MMVLIALGELTCNQYWSLVSCELFTEFRHSRCNRKSSADW